MTRMELESGIRRLDRYRNINIGVMAVAVFGTPIVNIGLRLPIEIFLGVFFGVPLLGFGFAFLILRVFGLRCPHCGKYLGMEKRNYYDITKTGRCRACGMAVIDEVAE